MPAMDVEFGFVQGLTPVVNYALRTGWTSLDTQSTA